MHLPAIADQSSKSMAGVITVAVMAGAIAVAEVITMDGVEATTMDGAIIVAGAVIVGSSSDILKQAASVWRLSQAALAARHAKPPRFERSRTQPHLARHCDARPARGSGASSAIPIRAWTH